VANKISVIIDVAVDKGVTQLKKFQSAIGEADTASGKMRAGFDVAKESIVANAANIAFAAGSALIAFGVQSVKAFQDTALAAGQFSDATGLSVEAASRLAEVAGDIGIDTGTVESALGRMNKTLGASPQLFTNLGVEIAKTDTGATDVNGTFLNVVDRLNAIEDPAERARVASQLLGKGWQGMAELIGQGSAGLKASLAGVGDAQVIDEKELKKAREFRDRMDELNDRLQAVMMTVGESLVPALSDAAETIGTVTDALELANNAAENLTGVDLFGWADKLTSPVGVATSAMNWFTDAIGSNVSATDGISYAWDYLTGNLEDGTTAIEDGTTAIEYGTDAADEMARMYGQRLNPTVADSTHAFDAAAEEANDLAIKTGIVERAAEALDTAWGNLKGEIDADQAWIDMQTTFDDLKSKGEAAMTAASNGSADARTKMLEFESATNTAKQKIIDLGQQIGLTPTEVKTLLTMTDNGSIEDVERRLAILTRNRSANVDIIARGGAGYGDRYPAPRAMGGPVTAGTPYLVGEKGPEIVVPGQSGTVIPNHRIGVGAAATGSPMTVNIYTNADPNSTKAALRRFDRRNGPGI